MPIPTPYPLTKRPSVSHLEAFTAIALLPWIVEYTNQISLITISAYILYPHYTLILKKNAPCR
nr:MAG TPA: hypothetical protein [Caudoviricetes sp.]